MDNKDCDLTKSKFSIPFGFIMMVLLCQYVSVIMDFSRERIDTKNELLIKLIPFEQVVNKWNKLK